MSITLLKSLCYVQKCCFLNNAGWQPTTRVHIPDIQQRQCDTGKFYVQTRIGFLLYVCCWWLKWNLSSTSFLPFHYCNVQGGFGTYDEMCIVFTYYYPQIDLSSCLSLPQFQQTYPTFLATYLWVCTRTLKHFLVTAHFWKLCMTNTVLPLILVHFCFLYFFH